MPTLDKVILNSTAYNLSGETAQRSTYHDSGDMYDLLSPLEVVSMKKSGYRIHYTPPREQAYTDYAIHYFDISSISDKKMLVGIVSEKWKANTFYYYNPADSSYTVFWYRVNGAGWMDLSQIPSGCYLCMSCLNDNYTTGGYKYLSALWINPEYTPKFNGLDESITSEALELVPNADMGAEDSNRPYFAIDMAKYKDCLVRLATTVTPSCTVRLYRTSSLTTRGTAISNSYNSSLGNFLPWVYEERYLVIAFITTNYSVFDNFDITLGWVDPEVARVNKQKKYWGIDLAAHNADSRSDLVSACVYADLVDIDVCRTLDGYYVCIHNVTINGHTIAETNLENLELTFDQLEITESFKILNRYGSYCYINFRETTVEQAAALMERAYNLLGRACVYSTFLVDQTSPLYGHASKFYIWRANNENVQDFVTAGADVNKVYCSGASNGDYTEYDYIRTGGYNDLASVPTDGSIALGFISATPSTVLNA